MNNFLNTSEKYVGNTPNWQSNLIVKVQEDGNNLISDINKLNNKITSNVGEFAKYVAALRDKMAEAVDMSLSMASISGNSNTQYDISPSVIYSSENVVVKNNSVYIKPKVANKYTIENIEVDTSGTYGNSSDYENQRFYNKDTIVSDTQFEVERFNLPVSATYTIRLSKLSPVNLISFKDVNFGVDIPEIVSVDVSSDGKSFKRIPFTVLNDSLRSIQIDESFVRVLRVTIVQDNGYISDGKRNRFAIGISNLSIGITTVEEHGEIIFGPFNSGYEILKASIAAKINNDGYSFNNSQFSISPDLTTWYDISTPYSISEKPKHLDFNTISDGSISTENPVRVLYLRIIFSGKKYSNSYSDNRVQKHTQSITKINPVIVSPFDLGEKYILGKLLNSYYGGSITTTSYSDITGTTDYISSIKRNNEYVYRSFDSMGYMGETKVRYTPKRCRVEKDNKYKIISSETIEPESVKVYSYSNPIRRDIRVANSENVVLAFNEYAGVYRLTDGNIYRDLDLTSGFFESCFQWTFRTYEKDLYLYGPSGVIVHTFKAGEPVNLLDYFTFTAPFSSDKSPVNMKFNKKYPEAKLEDSEFTIIDGKIFAHNSSAIINSDYVVKNKLDITTDFSINSIDIYTDDVRLSKTSESLNSYDGLKVAKLLKTQIIKGSLEFSYKNASVFTFLKEVDFINGIDEFNTGNSIEIQLPKGANKFSLGRLIDHFSGLNFVGYTDIFKTQVYSEAELIYAGDYLLTDENNQTYITLADNAKTHDLIDTSVILDTNISSAGTGYYSIDYNNGIIYSQSIISGDIRVSYLYSNVFIEGQSMETIDKEKYGISGRTVTVKEPSDSDTYAVLSLLEDSITVNINKSPVVSNITLNTVIG